MWPVVIFIDLFDVVHNVNVTLYMKNQQRQLANKMNATHVTNHLELVCAITENQNISTQNEAGTRRERKKLREKMCLTLTQGPVH